MGTLFLPPVFGRVRTCSLSDSPALFDMLIQVLVRRKNNPFSKIHSHFELTNGVKTVETKLQNSIKNRVKTSNFDCLMHESLCLLVEKTMEAQFFSVCVVSAAGRGKKAQLRV